MTIFRTILAGIFVLALFHFSGVNAQEVPGNPTVHGNFQIDAQTYHPDEDLGITDSVLQGKELRMNGYGDVRFSMWKFNAGIRYEAYLPPLAGYDPQYQGQGIPFWFVEYGDEKLQVTAGHFYEQFGMGMILRSYQQWDLGYDNSINGFRVKYSPVAGLSFKALIGVQRLYWEPFADDNRGIVRGFDGELMMNDAFDALKDKKTRIILGGSFVSKYEKMQTKTLISDTTKYEYQLPANVASAGGRVSISNGGFNFYTEYTHKFNNPSAFNNYIYKDGQALLSSISYSQKGIGVYLAVKSIDNMSYKSKMTELNTVLDINFIPPLTKQFVYSLENVYPYATQLNGETAFQGQAIYTIPKGTGLGGKYGTKLEVNYSKVFGLDKQAVAENIPVDSTGTLGYKASLFSFGDLYYQSVAAEVEKKMGKKMKLILEYVYIDYNVEVIEGHPGEPMVHANEFNVDFTYKLSATKSLRLEYEQLLTKQDKGDWAMVLLEYNIAPKWFFSLMDQYNYGNPAEDLRLHYYTAAMAFVQGPHRIALSYGRQREGLLCVGGVCRQVPASNGFTLNISTSF
jgi:hypothetical protein